MGSAAKIILVAATSLVVGVYAVSLKKVQTINIETAMIYVKAVDDECGTEDAALRVAVYRVQAGVTLYRDRPAPIYSALSIAGTRTALGGGEYTYNLYVPYGQYNATGYVDVTPLNKPTKRIYVTVDKVIGTGCSLGTPKGTKPGYRSYVRGAWQITQSTR